MIRLFRVGQITQCNDKCYLSINGPAVVYCTLYSPGHQQPAIVKSQPPGNAQSILRALIGTRPTNIESSPRYQTYRY